MVETGKHLSLGSVAPEPVPASARPQSPSAAERGWTARLQKRVRQRYARWRSDRFDDFVFIHINKTGGSSIEKVLSLPFEHKTALEKIAEMGRNRWDRRFSFAVVRNPWDKVVSHYAYRVQTNQTGLKDRPLEFGEWVRRAYGDRDPAYYDNARMFMPQTDWITDTQGTLLVNTVCRFETLSTDFGEVCARIGRRVVLLHEKASRHGHYRQYYDEQTRALIGDRFRSDLDNFGYEF
jgi:hypothetical protein